MLTTASQFTPRARPVRTRHVLSVRALGAGSAQGIRQQQQTRDFRWGLWSNLDDELSREVRRRHRMLKRKYLSEQLTRRPPWENHPFAEESRQALRRLMKSYWHSSYSSRRFFDDVEPTKHESPDNKAGVRPGRNIEDVERGAMEHLIYGKNEVPAPPHPYTDLSNAQRQKARKSQSASHTYYGQPIEQEDFIIDPITNRKVAKPALSSSLKDGFDIPVKTFKDYRSQFANPRAGSCVGRGARSDDVLKYSTLRDSGLEDNLASSVKGLSKNHGDVPKHWAAVDEVHGKFEDLQPPRENLKGDGYESVVADKVASRFEAAESRDSNHSNSSKIETDTKRDTEPPHHESDQHGSVRLGGKPLGFIEDFVKPEVLRRYRSSIHNVEPSDFPKSTVEDLRAKYGVAELKQYTAVRHVDPDEGSNLTAQEVRQQYDDLSRWNEPPILDEPLGTLSSSSEVVKERDDQEELAKYGPRHHHERNGGIRLSEETHKNLHGHDDPVSASDLDTKFPLFEQGANLDNNHAKGENHDDVSVAWYETDGKHSSHEAELNHLKTRNGPHDITYHETDRISVTRMKPAQENVDAQIDFGSPCVKSMEASKDSLTGYEALGKLTSVKQGHGRKSSSPQSNASDQPAKGPLSDTDTVDEPALRRPSLERLASIKQGQGKMSNYREMLESLMNQHEQLSNAHDEEATLAVKSSKAKNQEVGLPQCKFTGNYMRDFPEEFEKSWTQTMSSTPAEETTTYENEAATGSEVMDGGLEGAFGHPAPSRIQPALSRYGSKQAAIDQDDRPSKEAQGSETSPHNERSEGFTRCGSASGAEDDITTEKQTVTTAQDEAGHKAAEMASGRVEETSSTSSKKPILYKVLAYDPTMQKINMAETTSLVPDFASALSPADALLRLSYPTKFFPHFASLEAEGFEIVSGSGDVLVFRKVRSSKPEQVEEQVATETSAAAIEPPATESPVNPIDMTGRPRMVSPASANFASPTGYVKYENLPETEASNLPPPTSSPRVAYNINLRREEPVYSGPKSRTYGNQKQKKSIGQRLIVGGVWVAGISYGLGVVSEYFTTGGLDGMGPQGL